MLQIISNYCNLALMKLDERQRRIEQHLAKVGFASFDELASQVDIIDELLDSLPA